VRFRHTLILVVVAIALGGLVLFLEVQEEPEPPDSRFVPTPMPELLRIHEDAITDVILERTATGQRTHLVRRTAADWYLLEPDVGPDAAKDVDAFQVLNFLETLAVLRPRRVLTGTLDLAEYGLAPAALKVTLHEEGGSTHQMRLGEMNADFSAYYVVLGDDEEGAFGTIYLVPSYVGVEIERLLDTPPIQGANDIWSEGELPEFSEEELPIIIGP
jgi:hypothetical protein